MPHRYGFNGDGWFRNWRAIDCRRRCPGYPEYKNPSKKLRAAGSKAWAWETFPSTRSTALKAGAGWRRSQSPEQMIAKALGRYHDAPLGVEKVFSAEIELQE